MEIQTRKNKRKRNSKPNIDCYHSPCNTCDTHANIIQGQDFKTKTGASQSLLSGYDERNPKKISFTNKVYTATGDSSIFMPEEILIEILSKLPINSLARFKCVSERWQQMISNTVPVRSVPKLLMFSKEKPYLFRSYDYKTGVQSACSSLEEHLLHSHKVKAHSTCNGLLLIQIDTCFFVWNPLTNFIRTVLTFEKKKILCYTEHLADLCFCSTNDEYKVVLVEAYTGLTWFKEDVFVATCGTNSWKMINNYPNCRVAEMGQGPFFKGYRHWICNCIAEDSDNYYRVRERPNQIVYFDASKDEFIEIAMPQPKMGGRDSIVNLGVFDECLCMTRREDSENFLRGGIEFLMLKEYGNGNSWNIMFVISTGLSYDMMAIYKTSECEVLVRSDSGYDGWNLKAYDAHGNFLRDILVVKRPLTDDLQVISYEESWFSPTGNDWGKKLGKFKIY